MLGITLTQSYARHITPVTLVNVDLELTLTTAPRFARAAGRNIGGGSLSATPVTLNQSYGRERAPVTLIKSCGRDRAPATSRYASFLDCYGPL